MSNTVGSINIEMLANLASLVSDMGKAHAESTKHAKEMAREWKESLDSVEEGFKSLAEIAGIAIGVEALREVAVRALEAAEQIDHMSQSLGVSVEKIQVMSFAAGLVGGNLDTVTTAFTRMERAAEQAVSGSAQQAEAFRAIGISASQLKELLKSPDQLIQQVAEHLGQFDDGAGKTAVTMQIFGRNAAQIIPYLNELGRNFEELEQRAAEFGIVLSSTDQKLLVSTQETFNELGQQLKGLGNQFTVALAPALKEIAQAFSRLLESENIRTAFNELGKGAKFLADNIGLITTAIEALLAKQAIQWAIGAATAIASVAKEAAIGAAVFAELTGAAVATSVAVEGLTAAGGAMLGLMGGIPGVIALAAVAIYELATYQDDAAKSADDLKRAEELLKNVTADSVTGDIARARSIEKVAEEHLTAAQAALAHLDAELAQQQGAGGFGESAALEANGYNLARQAADELRTKIVGLTLSLAGQRNEIATATADFRRFSEAVIDVSQGFVAGDIAGNMKKYTDGANEIHATAERMIEIGANAVIVHAQEDAALQKLADSLHSADRAQVDYNAHAKEGKKYIDESGDALLTLQAVVDKLSSGFGSPYKKALDEYNGSLIKLQQEAQAAAIKGADVDAVIKLWQEGEQDLKNRLDETNAAIARRQDILGQLHTKLEDETRLLGLNAIQRKAEQAVIEAETKARDLYNQKLRESPNLTQAEIAAIKEDVHAHELQDAAIERTKKVQQEWQQIAVSGFDSVGNSIAQFATGGIKTWHDFGQSLIGDAKQFIAAIIEQFLKLAVFNNIINGLFHLNGTGNELATFGNLLGGGGGVGAASAGGSSPMASGLFSPSSWTSAGQNMFSGFQSAMNGAGNLWSSATGAYTYTSPIMTGPSAGLAGEGSAGANAFAGAQAGGSFGAPAYGGYGSALGQGLGIAGGVVAGYNEFKAAGGGAAGIAGGVAYGVGTYFAGAAVTAGLGAAAAGGLSAGLAAGMAAIPVVGWIALAAMAINLISGGKLFGTSANKFVSGVSTETITATGADVDTKATYKGQRALFGGSYYKTRDIAVSAEAEKGADDFFAALKKGQGEFVAFFGDTLKDQVDIVGGSFATTFDKNGKATGTTDTVLGVTRKETDQQFAERLQADSYLAVLDKMGIGASAFVAGLQDDADKLFAGVQDLASVAQNAFTNIGKGFTFMALGADAALPEVMKFVIGLNQGGETLSQTYQRLMQAQAQYDQLVAQFKPTATYVDPFEASLSNLYHQMLSAQDQANALAIAAGADGASLTDLANISKAFAGQMAQAVIQLESSAQQLAFSLGLTLFGSLDQVNGEIARLTGANTAATSSISNFGNAITETAQKADAALNLMLGNLSPLNDQQKLQLALQGLRAGTVSADQVLSIGRSLYASSQAYTDLFNQVMPYAGQQAAGGGSYVGGSSTSTTDHTQLLSQADQEKLAALMKERDSLQAAQTLQQYQTLARQIEEIAQAKGETFDQVIKEMGIDQAALEKGLSIKSDADFAAYMDQMKKQLDSAGENTTSIVTAINSGTQQLVLAITGKLPVNPHDITALATTGTTTDGTKLGTRGFTSPGATQPGMKVGRTTTDDDVKAYADAVAQAFSKYMDPQFAQAFSKSPRSRRALV